MLDELQHELAQHQPVRGISILDAMELPGSVGTIIRLIIRHGPIATPALAQLLSLDPSETAQIGALLVTHGLISSECAPTGETIYQIRFAETRQRRMPPRLRHLFDEES